MTAVPPVSRSEAPDLVVAALRYAAAAMRQDGATLAAITSEWGDRLAQPLASLVGALATTVHGDGAVDYLDHLALTADVNAACRTDEP
ncbi:hypothetical protein O7635_27850 [Asanoa sp. WMMD1127]|uniref:hypothetical protein n=1 Tax=Asanoa sp. WMMD1127 TaxID=3016107 RepID=UPI0024175203|nr:hypothetical protein [Asanoa sp. WMMD1127]MDG4825677.1 hypothetical protein [Asanoa sp. WMMD1127]